METDLSLVDPAQAEEIRFEGLRSRPDPYAPPQMPQTPPQTHEVLESEPGQHFDDDAYMYYNQPPPPRSTTTNDIFSNMDRTTYILLIMAFIVGFFVGRGMIQPVILRHT